MNKIEEEFSLLNRQQDNEYKIVITKRMILFGVASVIGVIIMGILLILFLTT